jgi:hypothetical protein
MRQATDTVMTGVELAKASSWLRYSQNIVCMRKVTGPVMTGAAQRRVAGSIIAEVSFA